MKLNESNYDKLKRYSDDNVYDDKSEYAVADWLNSYGANIRSELNEEGDYAGFVTFGSVFAVANMLERFRKQVVRETLDMLIEEHENDKNY